MRQIFHEIAATQHRLIIVKEGIPISSQWQEYRQVGKFHNIYFHVGAAGDLPSVFRASGVEHEVL